MKWIVLVPVYRPDDTIKYKKYTFETKEKAEDFRNGLKTTSEIYSVSYKKEQKNE